MASLTSDLSAPVQVKGDYLRAGVQGSTTPERYLLTRTTASSCRSMANWSGMCIAMRSAPPATSSTQFSFTPSPLSAFLSPA
ncbi:unnamed protein product [Urochloa humidicola]